MKIKIGSYEAKTKLPELLRQVKAGKSFTITNRGEAIADLVPSAGMRAKDKVAAAEKLKAFMRADPVRGVDIKELDGCPRFGHRFDSIRFEYTVPGVLPGTACDVPGQEENRSC